MRAVYNRERKVYCGDLLQVDIFAVTPEEHGRARRGKKVNKSDEKQRLRNERHSTQHRFWLANANFSERGVYFTGSFKEEYRPEDVDGVRAVLGNFLRRVQTAVHREFHLPKENMKVLGVCAGRWRPDQKKSGKGNAPHVHVLIEYIGMRESQNARFRELLEDQWRTGRGKLENRDRLGEANSRKIHMDMRLAGLIEYFANHKTKGDMVWYQSRNLRQPDIRPPNDTRWTAKQVFKARDMVTDRDYWAEKYPGYKLFKAEVIAAPEELGIDPEEDRRSRGWYEPIDMPRLRVLLVRT